MAYIFLQSDNFCLLAAERTVVWRKPASGDMFGPYKHPADHLDLVHFCSDWDYYAQHSRTLITLTHQAVAGITIYDGRGFGGGAPISVGQVAAQEQVLVTHSLGYIPRFNIAQDNRVLPAGMNVQNLGDRGRLVSFYATTSVIGVRNLGVSSSADLPAINISYDVVVYKNPNHLAPMPRLPMFWATPSRAVMGRGKVDTNTTTMRIGTVADAPFFIPTGRNIDFDNGRARVVLPNGPTITEDGYGGSFSGSGFLRTFI